MMHWLLGFRPRRKSDVDDFWNLESHVLSWLHNWAQDAGIYEFILGATGDMGEGS